MNCLAGWVSNEPLPPSLWLSVCLFLCFSLSPSLSLSLSLFPSFSLLSIIIFPAPALCSSFIASLDIFLVGLRPIATRAKQPTTEINVRYLSERNDGTQAWTTDSDNWQQPGGTMAPILCQSRSPSLCLRRRRKRNG